MSINDPKENEEEELEYTEQEETASAPSGMSLFVDRIKRWLNAQNKMLTYGVGAVLVIVIGYLCYMNFYKLPKEKEAIAAIYKVQELFDTDSFKQVLKTAPKLADKFSGTKGGELAAYMAGTSYLYTGDFKKAIKYLEEVDFKDHLMSVQVIGLLGDAYVESKNLDEALKHYLKAAKKAKVEFAIVWWSKKAARVYEKKNEWKKALELYQDIKKNHREDEMAIDIDKYIARAQAKLGEY
jgi:predicted negative regulator of RcsB-dependent stress response